jgi:hypothetical protein
MSGFGLSVGTGTLTSDGTNSETGTLTSDGTNSETGVSTDIGTAIAKSLENAIKSSITDFIKNISDMRFFQHISAKIKRFDENYVKRGHKIFKFINFLIISALFYLSYLYVPTVILVVINILLTAILFHYFKKL